jgi:chromosome segregation ATPase
MPCTLTQEALFGTLAHVLEAKEVAATKLAGVTTQLTHLEEETACKLARIEEVKTHLVTLDQSLVRLKRDATETEAGTAHAQSRLNALKALCVETDRLGQATDAAARKSHAVLEGARFSLATLDMTLQAAWREEEQKRFDIEACTKRIEALEEKRRMTSGKYVATM